MPQLVIDGPLSEKLKAQQQPVEFVDPSGRVLGVYEPFLREPQLSEEEWDRIRREPGGKRLTDILGDRGRPS